LSHALLYIDKIAMFLAFYLKILRKDVVNAKRAS